MSTVLPKTKTLNSLVNPTSLGPDLLKFKDVKIPAGFFPAGYEFAECLTLENLADIIMQQLIYEKWLLQPYPSIGNGGGGSSGGDGDGDGGDGGDGGGGGVGPEIPQEPEWDIKCKVNGQWIYEITGQTVEQSESRNEQYRLSATELVVSDNVTKIGFFAFRFWNALISVKLGNSVTSLGYYSFENCTRLKSIDLPDSLEILEANALGDCNTLEVLDFGANLKLIKDWALVNLYQLHTIVFRSNTPFTAEGYAYGNGGSGGTNHGYIYVPDHLINEYEVPLWNLASKERYRPLSQYNG